MGHPTNDPSFADGDFVMHSKRTTDKTMTIVDDTNFAAAMRSTKYFRITDGLDEGHQDSSIL
jgi:hypothetical protein